MELRSILTKYLAPSQMTEANTLTTATLGDHLAAQGVEAYELYSRGARVRKRDTSVDANRVVAPTEFLAVKVVTSTGVGADASNCAVPDHVPHRPRARVHRVAGGRMVSDATE